MRQTRRHTTKVQKFAHHTSSHSSTHPSIPGLALISLQQTHLANTAPSRLVSLTPESEKLFGQIRQLVLESSPTCDAMVAFASAAPGHDEFASLPGDLVTILDSFVKSGIRLARPIGGGVELLNHVLHCKKCQIILRLQKLRRIFFS